MLGSGKSSSSDEGRGLRVERSEEGRMLGLVRKVSTYFVCICRYWHSAFAGCYETGLVRRLLGRGRVAFAVEVVSKLMNFDLISYEEGERRGVRCGGVIGEIVVEEEGEVCEEKTNPYKVAVEHCGVRECAEVYFMYLWWASELHARCVTVRRRKGRNHRVSKLQKTSIVDNGEPKKIKRVAHSRSSIRVTTSPVSEVFHQDLDARVSHSRNPSRRDVASERGIE